MDREALQAAYQTFLPTLDIVMRRHKQLLFERLKEMPLPSKAREEWRYLNLSGIESAAYQLAMPIANSSLELPFDFPVNAFLFINGQVMLTQSSITLDDEEKFELTVDEPDMNEQVAHFYDGLRQLFVKHRYLLKVKDNVQLSHPIVLVVDHSSDSIESFSALDMTVDLGNGSKATVIELFQHQGSSSDLMTYKLDLTLGESSQLSRYQLFRDFSKASLFYDERVRSSAFSDMKSFSYLHSGELLRFDRQYQLVGHSAKLSYHQLSQLNHETQCDTQLMIQHQANEGSSSSVIDAIANGRSTFTMNGLIQVNKGTIDNEARLNNRNLLLSDDAKINTKPVLKIFADRVNCSHGATTGSFDDEAIQFLKSRGFSDEAARALLLHAVMNRFLNHFDHVEIKGWVMHHET